jgi:hypothetical protein
MIIEDTFTLYHKIAVYVKVSLIEPSGIVYVFRERRLKLHGEDFYDAT